MATYGQLQDGKKIPYDEFSKEEVKKEILSANRPIEFPMSLLRFPFGFIRIDGKEFMMRKLLNPSLTEEQASMCPPNELKENIESWCKEEKIFYQYNIERDSYVFAVK